MSELHRIAIVGLGQIGGSLALAIRKRKLRYRLTGIDASRKRTHLLKRDLDVASTSIKRASDADLVILCLHFRDIMTYLRHAPKNQLILDVCSAKQKINDCASSRGLRFIGGHPMAGNERSGEAGWDADLFHDRPFFLCPTDKIKSSDLPAVRKLLASLGAKCTLIDPAKHDRQVAMTSHFAAILSVLYADLTKDSGEKLRGPGYRSMTRLARTSPELLRTFIEANGENVFACVQKFERMLRDFRARHSRCR